MYKKTLAATVIAAHSFYAAANDSNLEEMTVLGSSDDIQSLSGSAHRVGRDDLEDFEYTDLNQVLVTVPGVYIRQEDGYGLRPNIGIRGVTAERSQKITIMEDGILITPAPYSAPAAYYIPNVNRMQAVEVFKGPAAIKFGPNTVGGALNLASRPVPNEATGEIDVSYGSDNFQKVRAFYGESFEQFGYMIEGLNYSADGFKELDGGGDTGFTRNDINAQVMWRSAESEAIQQRVDVKLGYADEDSDETYLGLTNDDFAANPLRRYIASGEDRFKSEHTQLHVIHQIALDDHLSFINRAYINRFDRSWFKLDGFIGDPDATTRPPALKNILDNPGDAANIPYLQLLRGERDSISGDFNDLLDLTDNDRAYGSQGISTDMSYLIEGHSISHNLEAGLRFHQDYVERNHQRSAYNIEDGQLGFSSKAGTKVLNKAESDAISAYLHDTMTMGAWILNIGARVESIESKLSDFKTPSKNNKRSNTEVLPGAGVFYQFNDHWGFLAGINKGFSPNGPSADESVKPEESINYEYGVRYNQDSIKAELIGFFSDYSNLIGRCRASDADCEVGDEFNGGAVEIAGFEASYEQNFQLDNLMIPLGLSYTYTESAFQESFISGFSQWGNVQKGDELPYLPEHQGRIYTGVKALKWDVLASIKFSDEMRDLPGQLAFDENQFTEALTVVDISASYFVSDQLTLQLNLDNITDEAEVVSFRPFGARPNKPRSVIGTVKYRF